MIGFVFHKNTLAVRTNEFESQIKFDYRVIIWGLYVIKGRVVIFCGP